MATARQSKKSGDEEATLPQTPPPVNQGFGHGLDPGFIWQQLSDIQSRLGAIQATQTQHSSSIEKLEDKLGGKISKIEGDVAEFKQIRHTAKVVGAILSVIAGLLLGGVGYAAKEVWTVLKPLATQAVQGQTSPAHTTPPIPKAPSSGP
ncbi:hypothetical protein N5D66_29515 [Delftia tsuruhatensis]|uniref:hypothetical protein n=1 Tax=Delftia tsuruhatensis TaxID=180282 RepID=UPI0024476CD3|nr:hypothetical protein [Delftia tsuruhatensis]MDH0852096.1 hypothetical protein [Delftia tsuruhatensis]